MEDKSMLTSMLIDNLIDDNQLKKILTNTPTASTSWTSLMLTFTWRGPAQLIHQLWSLIYFNSWISSINSRPLYCVLHLIDNRCCTILYIMYTCLVLS